MCVRACACVGVTGGGEWALVGPSVGRAWLQCQEPAERAGLASLGGGAQVSVGVTGQQNE